MYSGFLDPAPPRSPAEELLFLWLQPQPNPPGLFLLLVCLDIAGISKNIKKITKIVSCDGGDYALRKRSYFRVLSIQKVNRGGEFLPIEMRGRTSFGRLLVKSAAELPRAASCPLLPAHRAPPWGSFTAFVNQLLKSLWFP